MPLRMAQELLAAQGANISAGSWTLTESCIRII
jgi:hypothetical protein